MPPRKKRASNKKLVPPHRLSGADANLWSKKADTRPIDSPGQSRKRRLQQGIDLQRRQQFPQAEFIYQSVLRDFPNDADALNLMGTLAAEAKRFNVAIDYLQRAIKKRPKDLVFRNNLGNTYILANKPHKAIDLLALVVRRGPKFIEAHINLARALRETGRPQEALKVFEHVIGSTPDNQSARVGRANTLLDLGRTGEAVQLFRSILADAPRNIPAYLGLSGALKFKEDDGELAKIDALLNDKDIQGSEREALHYAAGKINDDLKRFDEAFQHYSKAKKASGLGFDIEKYSDEVTKKLDVYAKDFFEKYSNVGHKSDRPIFIVGMPRSGTTLTEQMLASHPDVFGAGELNDFNDIARPLHAQMLELAGTTQPDEKWLRPMDARRSAEIYLDVLRRHSPSALRVTDKMPHNFEYLGIIVLLFPNARIIHCRRNPMDTCVSCYTHQFREQHGYNANLRTLGLYYRQYHRLMKHWTNVLDEHIFEVCYEEMIADQVGTLRRLLDFLSLPWDESCVRFHESERAVSTPSRWQVRQPIYQSSLERWKNYEEHLAPLRGALGELA